LQTPGQGVGRAAAPGSAAAAAAASAAASPSGERRPPRRPPRAPRAPRPLAELPPFPLPLFRSPRSLPVSRLTHPAESGSPEPSRPSRFGKIPPSARAAALGVPGPGRGGLGPAVRPPAPLVRMGAGVPSPGRCPLTLAVPAAQSPASWDPPSPAGEVGAPGRFAAAGAGPSLQLPHPGTGKAAEPGVWRTLREGGRGPGARLGRERARAGGAAQDRRGEPHHRVAGDPGVWRWGGGEGDRVAKKTK
jgi:hypothetical protein